MKYWIFSLPRPDMEHCIKIGIFGLNRNYLLGKMSPEDPIVCYVTGEMKIIALGAIASEYYLDDEQVFKADGIFPDRIRFTAERLSAEISFPELVPRLNFVKNKEYWSVYLRRGVAELHRDDWELISAECQKAATSGKRIR